MTTNSIDVPLQAYLFFMVLSGRFSSATGVWGLINSRNAVRVLMYRVDAQTPSTFKPDGLLQRTLDAQADPWSGCLPSL